MAKDFSEQQKKFANKWLGICKNANETISTLAELNAETFQKNLKETQEFQEELAKIEDQEEASIAFMKLMSTAHLRNVKYLQDVMKLGFDSAIVTRDALSEFFSDTKAKSKKSRDEDSSEKLNPVN